MPSSTRRVATVRTRVPMARPPTRRTRRTKTTRASPHGSVQSSSRKEGTRCESFEKSLTRLASQTSL
eukprot:5941676-Pleurochrysis_carterae.AAC.1